MENRDVIVVTDEFGQQLEFGIEGLFEVDDESYVLLTSDEDTLLMKIEGEGEDQELVGIEDPELLQSLLDAYQLAVAAAPAEGMEH